MMTAQFPAGKSSFPVGSTTPQFVYLPASSPPNIPLLTNQTSTTSSVSEDQAPQAPTAFQPIPLMGYQPTPMVPVIQIQTPNGPQFQPVYYLGDPALAGTPPIPATYLAPEIHPVMQASDSMKRSKSNSSVDGRSSFNGSEISDSGDPRFQRSTSGSFSGLHRGYSYSDVSISRDGGYGITDASGDEEESPKIDVESPEKMFYSTAAGSGNQDALVSQINQMNQGGYMPQVQQKKKECDAGAYSHYRCIQAKPELSSTSELNEEPQETRRYSKGSYQYHSSDRSKKRPTSKERQEELYKTELCSYWINGQKCRFGKRCIFAHGQHELRRPKRKIERARLRPPYRKQITTLLGKLNDSNFDTICSDLLCATVEEVVDDKKNSQLLTKTLFNKAVTDTKHKGLLSEIWRKLLNVHPMAQTFARQMMDLCISEYKNPSSNQRATGNMQWIARLCSKKTLSSEELVHRILSEMFNDQQSEQNVELWCTLIESLRSTVDTSKYFPQLAKLKTKFNARIRFMIMDLEDLKKRNWVRRQ